MGEHNRDQPISTHDPWWRRLWRRLVDWLEIRTLEDWAKRHKREAERQARHKNNKGGTP